MLNKKIFFFLVVFFISVLSISAQEPVSAITGTAERVNQIQQLYRSAEYAQCLQLIDTAIKQHEDGSVGLPFFQLARVYIFKALVVYAYREEGFQETVKELLLKAVSTDINFEFDDYAIIPTYIVDMFVKIKREYLEQFSKTTRRHTLGVYGSLTALPTLLDNPEYLKPGIHYSFNFSESFMLLADVEFPASGNIFNTIMGRAGVIWFPSFKIETVSMGLGMMYAMRVERNANTLHVFSVEGYGELILRFGLGLAASIELVRFDLSVGDYPSNFSSGGAVSFFQSDSAQLSFANLRIYIFFTF